MARGPFKKSVVNKLLNTFKKGGMGPETSMEYRMVESQGRKLLERDNVEPTWTYVNYITAVNKELVQNFEKRIRELQEEINKHDERRIEVISKLGDLRNEAVKSREHVAKFDETVAEIARLFPTTNT